MHKLVIDPGHGGRDSGAVGPSGLREKDVALAVCKHLASDLDDVSTVYLTRWVDRDFGVSVTADLQARCDYANSIGADLFVSVHCNSAANSTAKGVETYAYGAGGQGERVAGGVQAELVGATALTDRGVKFANFHVLRETAMPAVLVELAFISNPQEEKLLADPAWQQKCVRAISAGVRKYLGLPVKEEFRVADEKVTVLVKGKEIPGKLIDGATWVPLRTLVEALTYQITWDGVSKTAKVE